MPYEPDGDAPAPRLDLEHLAALANLPLEDEELEELSQACTHVLEAFHLADVEAAELPEPDQSTFEDAPSPAEPAQVDAILAAVPRKDGRYLLP